MKKQLSMAFFGLFMTAALTSCKKDEVSELTTPEPPVVENKISRIQQTIAYVAQHHPEMKNNMGNGAVFIEPTETGATFGVIANLETGFDDDGNFGILNGQIGLFTADYGSNDFWLQMPDGNINVHVVSNQAEGAHFDFGTEVEHLGAGNCNFNYTGEFVSFDVPFPPFEITFLALSDATAISIHGQANVTVDGEAGPSKKLRIKSVSTPSGQNSSTLSLK